LLRRRYFPFEFFRACFVFSGTTSLLHTQDLQSSIACLKTLRNNPSLTKAPPLRDSIDDFSLKSNALMQRVGAMFALCTEEFSEHRRVGCGWDGVVDDARARLAHAQVVFLTLRLIASPSLPHCFCSCLLLQITGIGDPAYLHVLSRASFVILCFSFLCSFHI
jgi:hypothetical protein